MKSLFEYRYCICIINVVLTFFISSQCFAKQYAYLIGSDGSVVKFDIETDTIVSTKDLSIYDIQGTGQGIVVDDTKKLLYIAHGRLTPSVSVFNLKTLELKKEVGITSGSPDVMIIAPPLSNKFYVDWWDDARNDRFFTSFDTTTFTKIADLSPYPNITFDIMYSADKSKLYSINDGYPAKIDVYNADNLSLIKSIPLEGIFTPNIFGRKIDDYASEKILTKENWKTLDKNPDIAVLYTYDILSENISKKINTAMDGYARLSPDGTEIFFNETQDILASDGSVEYVKSLGRLHIYNVATGQKRGTINFTVDKRSGIAGVHPNGNKLYISAEIAKVPSLIVIDVVNFKVIKTIKIPRIPSMRFWSD